MSTTTTVAIPHYISLLNQCISSKKLKFAQSIHSLLLKSSLISHAHISNRLIFLYSTLDSPSSTRNSFADLKSKNIHSYNTLLSSIAKHDISQALNLFDQIPDKNLVSYNTIISASTRHGFHNQALILFKSIPKCLHLDQYSIVAIATACVGMENSKTLKQVHAFAILNGLAIPTNVIISNVFIDGYGKCNDLDFAQKMFDEMPVKDVVSWTSLLVSCTKNKRTDLAQKYFHSMPIKNQVSWTALISGYEQNGQEEEAIDLFDEMIKSTVEPTPSTLVSVMSAYAKLGLFQKGKQMHTYVVRRPDLVNVFTSNALIDLYAKCGHTKLAFSIFDSMPKHDVVSYNSVIVGCAQNGLGSKSLEMFDNMVRNGFSPTKVTFLGVLTACSHAGLVDEGRNFLKAMEKVHGVCPNIEHYAAFIDTLVRKSKIQEALEVIGSLSLGKESVGVLGALLGGCLMHGDVEIGKRTAEMLFGVEPENGVRYVTMSNIYAGVGKWEEAKGIRMEMKRKGLKKDKGFSWIEIRSCKYVFGCGDLNRCDMEGAFDVLWLLGGEMKGEECEDMDLCL